MEFQIFLANPQTPHMNICLDFQLFSANPQVQVFDMDAARAKVSLLAEILEYFNLQTDRIEGNGVLKACVPCVMSTYDTVL